MASAITVFTPPHIGDSSPSFANDTRETKRARSLTVSAVEESKASEEKEQQRAANRERSNSVKRKYSVNDKYFYKRRRKESIILPTKFLLGGNINDPLNLASIANNGEQQVTPRNSPEPSHKKEVEVIIPANINDPLNLNCAEEESEANGCKCKSRGRKKKRKRTDSETTVEDDDKEKETSSPNKTLHINLNEAISSSATKCEKIVSPVIPQNVSLGKHRKITPEKVERFQKKGFEKFNKGKKHNFKQRDARFRYGNYNRYYGYRNPPNCEDVRLANFKRTWFENKDVLDIGCNVGFLTLTIAKKFNPKKIVGIDIDENLVQAAKRNIRHYITKEISSKEEFPISLLLCHGPLAASTVTESSATENVQNDTNFPNNVVFLQCNYVLESDEQLEGQKPEFDCILCLSITKWIHLNWGDSGLKRFFKRIYSQLRPGGILILEAQPWCSYKRKKFVTEETLKNYFSLNFKPEQFNDYLLSKEVGFTTCQLIDTPEHASKGFRRPIFAFTKSDSVKCV
ncbi:7SK snRNA methylphosphate capping enzyme-like protein [Dinothrombium tinctorium]|uniref:RNA methyltransferase n=1 Tax=Dinothrombium tinctorium TaxID=1965070 RepID=A0A3S3SLP3_9ACAR|nr:7SK snRNA methylphosphate capping enzyme-like protein [Dinothrombium tinctorium]RWS16878.1 7SK snRNA methylphosphate capping enzyme-like protein [Dinothrombium tinctorium]